MHYYYLLLDIGTLFFPVVLSFDTKVHYFKNWLNSLLAAVIVGIPFIIWDVMFTERGIWGFNPDYLTGFYIFNLPLEEVLFFLAVPFACTFIYVCCKAYLKETTVRPLNVTTYLLVLLYAAMILYRQDGGSYSIAVLISSGVTLILWRLNYRYSYIGFSFLLSMIPFLIMNGALTGSFTDAPVVWYNDSETIGVRLFTIPMEDVLYSLSMIVPTILTFELLNKRRGV